MDHLPLPKHGLAHAPIEVPFLCHDTFSYDDQGFLTFPCRLGVDLDAIFEGGLACDEILSFLQAWLWFGLIGEIIGIGSRTNVPQRITSFASFIKTKEDGSRIIDSSELPKHIVTAGGHKQAPLYNRFHQERFDSCMSFATDTVQKLITIIEADASRANMEQTRLSRVVLLSVQILVETLVSMRPLFHPHPPTLSNNRFVRFRSDIVDHLLLRSGWCARDLPLLSPGISIRYALSFISREETDNHRGCIHRVRGELLERVSYTPSHTTPDCNCRDVTICEAETEVPTRADQILLLSFPKMNGAEERVLELEAVDLRQSAKSVPKYIAISHCRATGLGNTESNTLPHCQMELLHKAAHNVLDDGSGRTLFWIDSMCIPVNQNARKLALKHVSKVFEQAHSTVVVEPSLLKSLVGSDQDCLLRLRYSMWEQRLWTLQEGFLAKRLHVMFANKIFSIDESLERLEQCPGKIFLSRFRHLTQPTPSHLKVILKLFDKDMKMIQALDRSTASLKIDRRKLHRLLRLALLACPRFCYLSEVTEYTDIALAAQTLQNIYCTPLGLKPDVVVCQERAIERLQILSSVDLARVQPGE